MVCLISQIVMSAQAGEYYPCIMDIMPATILRHHGLGIHVEIFISRLTMWHNTVIHSLTQPAAAGHILQTINNFRDYLRLRYNRH